MFFLYKPVQLVQTKKILLKDRKFGQVFEENVIQEKGPHSNTADLYFINKKNKYIWDESIQMFRKLRNVDETLNQCDFYKMHGLSPNEVKERLKTFGTNIIKISVPPVLHLIIHEVFCKQRLYTLCLCVSFCRDWILSSCFNSTRWSSGQCNGTGNLPWLLLLRRSLLWLSLFGKLGRWVQSI